MRVRKSPPICPCLLLWLTSIRGACAPCAAVLKIAPSDKDAVHSKVAVLTELGRFDEALQAIAAYPAAPELAFEKACPLHVWQAVAGPGYRQQHGVLHEA